MKNIILVLSVLVLPFNVFSQVFLNLDMEYYSTNNGYPKAWLTESGSGIVHGDSINKISGEKSLSIRHNKNDSTISNAYIYQAIPKDVFAGKKTVTMTVYLKTFDINKGNVEFYCYTLGPKNSVLSIDTTNKITTSKDWEKYEIELSIDTNTLELRFGVSDGSNGDLWIDNFEISFDGTIYNDITLKNPSPDEINCLKSNLTSLKFQDNEMNDINKIADFFKDSKIVGLGECTHGSKEIFLTKNSIIKYLIQNEGFNVIAFEANMPECDKINDYVLTGEGDPKELLSGIHFWTWNTQEVLDLINWIKDYNIDKKNKVYFAGCDMQYCNEAIDYISNYYPSDTSLTRLVKDFKTCKNVLDTFRTKTQIYQLPDTIAKPLCNTAYNIYTYCDSLFNKAPKDSILNKVHQYSKILTQFSDFTSKISNDFRDKCMAENIAWIHDSYIPNSKIIIWAHNGHVNKKSNTLGGILSVTMGKSYKAIGFTTEQGTYTAYGYKGISNYPLSPSETGSFEYYFKKAEEPDFFIDLDKISCANISAQWLCDYKLARDIGAMHTDSQFLLVNFKDLFNGILYIEKTTYSDCFNIQKKK